MKIALALFCLLQISYGKNLVVYSARNEQLIKPIFKNYTKENGIPIQYITDKEGPLLQRLKAEGKKSPADILLTVDAGNLWKAANENLLAPTESSILKKNIPPHLKDPNNRWFGFSVRARTIFYNKEKVKASELSGYADLADKKWQGRLCLRTSKKVYNQSLVAMMIAEKGEQETEKLIRSWVNNLATKVFTNDTKLLEAIDAGQCDVGIANTYYYGRLQRDGKAQKVEIYFPKKKDGGVHVNVSGAGIVKTSRNKEGAQKFLEWLSSKKAQKLFAGLNFEFPANPEIPSVKLVKAWGDYEANTTNLSEAGRLQTTAVRLMDRAQYR